MHPYDVRDLFLHRQFKRVEGASSHRRLAFTISCALEDRDGYGSEAWLLEPGSGHAPRRLTPQFAAVSSLRFDARGERLALLATGGSGKQVAVLDVATCEAHPVEGLEGTPLSIEMWHPDGKRLLVTVERPFTEDAAATGGKDGGPRVVNYLPSRRDGARSFRPIAAFSIRSTSPWMRCPAMPRRRRNSRPLPNCGRASWSTMSG